MITLEKIRLAFPEKKWMEVEGFQDYIVSDRADVYSLKRGILLKTSINRYGYCKVRLYDEINGSKDWSVHRLVCKAFLPNPLDKRTVNHFDGNKSNNHVDNLNWATDSENQLHSYEAGLSRRREGSDNHASRPVVKINRSNRELIAEYPSAHMAARLQDSPIRDSGITAVCRKEMHHYAGYYWMWKEDMVSNGIPNPLPSKKLRVKKIDQLDILGNYITTFNSLKEAADAVGMKKSSHISAVANGSRRQTHGFKWKYHEEIEEC